MRFLSISFLGLSFLILALFNTLTFADDAELNKKINNCNQLVKDGNSEKALEESAILLKKNQNNRELVLCKARAQMSLEKFVELVTENPRRLFKCKNKGRIEIGFDADFTVESLQEFAKWIIK